MKNIIITSTLAITLLFPGVGFAQTSADRLNGQARTGQGFCENIDEFLGRITDRLVTRRDQVNQKIETKKDEIATRRQARKDDWEAKKAENKEKINNRLSGLKEKYADNQEVLDAIDEFIASISDLHEDRITKLGEVRTTHEEKISALVEKRNQETSDLVDSYKAKVEALVEAARTSCQDEEDGVTVRNTLRTGLAALREEFAANKPSRDTYIAEHQAIKEETKSSIEAINSSFRQSFQTARDTLRTVLENNPV